MLEWTTFSVMFIKNNFYKELLIMLIHTSVGIKCMLSTIEQLLMWNRCLNPIYLMRSLLKDIVLLYQYQ